MNMLGVWELSMVLFWQEYCVQGQTATANRTIVVNPVCGSGETACKDGQCARVCPEKLVLASSSTDDDIDANTAPSVRRSSHTVSHCTDLERSNSPLPAQRHG